MTAAGSRPLLPPISGLKELVDKDGGRVYSILGLIQHIGDFPESMEGKKIAVVGGGAVGLDVVEFFTQKKAEVSIIEMMAEIGRDLDPVTKNDAKSMMKKYNVAQLTGTALLQVKDSSFLLKKDDNTFALPFDYGFICLGMRAIGQPFETLSRAFSADSVEVINVGDSKRARRIIDGTFEGRNIIHILEQKGFL